MTLRNRYKRRQAHSARPPNPITDSDLDDIGRTVKDVLDYHEELEVTPRGSNEINQATVEDVVATVATHTKPEKTLAFTAKSYVHGRLFQPGITRNVYDARNAAESVGLRYLQARLHEFRGLGTSEKAYGFSKRAVGEYLLGEAVSATDVDLSKHPSE